MTAALHTLPHCPPPSPALNPAALFNTATFYGPLNVEGYGHNLRLLAKCLAQPGIDRSKLQIVVKIGMDTRAP